VGSRSGVAVGSRSGPETQEARSVPRQSGVNGLRWAAIVFLEGFRCVTAPADIPHGTTVPALNSRELVVDEPAPTDIATLREEPLGRSAKIVARAREEVARRVVYDPAYVPLSFRDEEDTGRGVYPGGDLDPHRGVCTDVVVRAFRDVGVDLQQLVHEDILARRAGYPAVRVPDANIDHRRVGPMLTFLRAHAEALRAEASADWKGADIVVWAFRSCPRCTPDHVGVVSDRTGPRGLPLVVHNIGPAPSEDDVLDAWTVIGHFRL
jgi:uncharacterized protein YijF (DUF1287 family)